MKLSDAHIEAIGHKRRIIFQDDILSNQALRSEEVSPERWDRIVDLYMSRQDACPNQIDSVWHEWGEGNTAVWPSSVLPEAQIIFPKWWKIGIDPIKELLEETRKRGREVFFSYRINGSDNDDLFDPPHAFEDPIPIKAEHPDWLIRKWHPYWNFAFQGVRELKLATIEEIAKQYDFDGISIDFARCPILFPEGQQWTCRELLTSFVRDVRTTLLEIGNQREKPYLLAVRVPEDLAGCHYDGIDVETWIDESLVDILVVGARTANADVAGFRNLITGSKIRLYPSWDDHHSSDGYRHPPLEIWRGVCANWWRYSPDGMHTFNLTSVSPETHRNLDIDIHARLRGGSSDELDLKIAWDQQCRVYNEIGSLHTLEGLDKIFFVERRGGGHGEDFTPNPDRWYTPRHAYFQTNMRAPLPADLDGSADTLLILEVADDVNRLVDSIKTLTLKIALSPNDVAHSIEARINNLLLKEHRVETEQQIALNKHFPNWLAFPVPPSHLAVGENLVGTRLAGYPEGSSDSVRIEKLELHIHYK